MAIKGAKTASKNNPNQRKDKDSALQKMYNGKKVKPVRYIDRDLGQNYMSAQFDGGSIVENEHGVPLKWSSI